MAEPQTDVAIVGSGLAGLAAAVRLSDAGLAVSVFEADDDVGGRVRTDVLDGYRLDRGFQVLLPGYPEVARTIDLPGLRPRAFTQGVIRVADGERALLAAPWKAPQALPHLARFASHRPGSAAGIAALSIRDALATGKRIREIGARSTYSELRGWGVSERTIEDVFRPFLAGVLLDGSLETSGRMFHLIWRSFLRGGTVLPAEGMAALPRQLAQRLPANAVQLDSEVTEATKDRVRLRGGRVRTARAVIVATDGTAAAELLPGLPEPVWRSVTTYYYRTSTAPVESPTLSVEADSGLLVNSTVLSQVAPEYAPAGANLVSASVPGTADQPDRAEPRVRETMAAMYETSTRDWELLATYPIRQALPSMPSGHPLRKPVRLEPGLYVCGDHRDTSSIQGALVSGRRAADVALRDIHGAARAGTN